MLEIVMELHQDLRFRVQVGLYFLKEHRQQRGLRQGGPAAGILCTIALVVVYSDAHEDVENHSDPEDRDQNATDPIKFKEAVCANNAAIQGLVCKVKRLQAFVPLLSLIHI